MDNFIKKHLQDILFSIEEIDCYFGDSPKMYDEFFNDLKLRRAIERNIEIIGEAMNRILKIDNKPLVITLASATSVCGTSAAIATAAASKAKKHDLSMAVSISIIFTILMMVFDKI